MNNYIYLNFGDLTAEKQVEIMEIARKEVAEETVQEDADDLNMDLEDLIISGIDNKISEYSHKGLFVFNI